MNKLSNHALATATLLAILLCLAGCQSNPQSKSASADQQSITAKQKEHDQLLEEWKTLKPGLTRLLSIEGELNLLLGQLEQLSSSLEENQSPTAIASGYSPTSLPTPGSEPISATLITAPIAENTISEIEVTATNNEQAETIAPSPTVATDANFALQVASITDMRRLPILWQEMMDKSRMLLSDLEPNFQKTHVNNTDYYRLKLGGFSTRQEASQKCNELKAAGMSCIVADYTSSNFAQLADYQEASLTAQNLLSIQHN